MRVFGIANANSHALITALRVAVVVGSLLFIINHGEAVVNKKMNRSRWISGMLTYCIPFLVSLHGQSQRTTQTGKR